MILLFPVARNVLAFLRAAPLVKMIVPFDSSITFHRFFGYICMSADTLAVYQHIGMLYTLCLNGMLYTLALSINVSLNALALYTA